MALSGFIELRESVQRAVAALFGTAVLVVITLTTLKFDDLDAALKSTVHFFVWSAALLGAYLILSVTGSLSLLTRPLWRRLWGYALMGVGTLTWLRGAYYVLLHYHVSGLEIVFMQTLIIASIILATSDLNKSVSEQRNGSAEAEPKPDSKAVEKS